MSGLELEFVPATRMRPSALTVIASGYGLAGYVVVGATSDVRSHWLNSYGAPQAVNSEVPVGASAISWPFSQSSFDQGVDAIMTGRPEEMSQALTPVSAM